MEPPQPPRTIIPKTRSDPERGTISPLVKTDSKTRIGPALIGLYKSHSSDNTSASHQPKSPVQRAQLPRRSSFQSTPRYQDLPLMPETEDRESFNADWKKQFKSLASTLKQPMKDAELYSRIDKQFRQKTGSSCIPITKIFDENESILEEMKKSIEFDQSFLLPINDEIKKAQQQFETIFLAARKHTQEGEALYQFFCTLLLCQSFDKFKECLVNFEKKDQSGFHTFAKYFCSESAKLVPDLEESYHLFRQQVWTLIKELKTMRLNAQQMIGDKSIWRPPFNEQILPQITRKKVIACISVEKLETQLPIEINCKFVQQIEGSYLQGVIHRFNKKRVSRHSRTKERELKEDFLADRKIPNELEIFLKLCSSAGWPPAEHLIWDLKSKLFNGEFITKPKDQLTCTVSVKKHSFRITQEKGYNTYKKIISHLDKPGPLHNGIPVGGFNITWTVSYSQTNKKFKAKLIISDWGVNDTAPIQDKWAFLRILQEHIDHPYRFGSKVKHPPANSRRPEIAIAEPFL